MSELLGFTLALFSTLLAGVISGLRLKPYLDAGAVYTPPTFALYPALIATGCAVFLLLLCQWRSKSLVNMGPVSFTGKQFFAFVWCLSYILVALTFFPYRPPFAPRAPRTRTDALGQRVVWRRAILPGSPRFSAPGGSRGLAPGRRGNESSACDYGGSRPTSVL
jgi:hypothetical protein